MQRVMALKPLAHQARDSLVDGVKTLGDLVFHNDVKNRMGLDVGQLFACHPVPADNGFDAFGLPGFKPVQRIGRSLRMVIEHGISFERSV